MLFVHSRVLSLIKGILYSCLRPGEHIVMTAKYRSLVNHFNLAFVSRGKFYYYGLLVALLLAHSESILHILLTIQDFSVYSLTF